MSSFFVHGSPGTQRDRRRGVVGIGVVLATYPVWSRIAARASRPVSSGPIESVRSGAVATQAEVGGAFVELDAGRLGLSPPTIVRFQGRDGEGLEIEVGPGAVLDLVALAEAFWRRLR